MSQNRSSAKPHSSHVTRTSRIALNSALVWALLLCAPLPFAAETERDLVGSTNIIPPAASTISRVIAPSPTPGCLPSWTVVDSPSANKNINALQAVSGSDNDDVWAVGHYDLFGTGTFRTLTIHWDGSAWSLIPSPNPGTDHDYLYGGTGSGNDVWAVGMYNNTGGQPGRTLTLHWNGSAWSQVIVPSPGASTNLLNAMTGSGSDVWAGGEYSDGQFLIQRTLTLHWDGNAALSGLVLSGESVAVIK